MTTNLCKICRDPRVKSVDLLLNAGKSARSIAAEMALPPESLKRHVRAGHHTPLGSLLPAPPQPGPLVSPGTTQSLRARLEAQVERLEGMANRPDIALQPYLAALRELRLLADALSKQGPPPDSEESLISRVLGAQEWTEFVVQIKAWLVTEDPTQSLLNRFDNLVAAAAGSPARWSPDGLTQRTWQEMEGEPELQGATQ
jgi:hypothetical protein